MKRSTKIILLIVAAFAAVSMVLTGCGKDSESISDNSAATADSVMTEPQEEVYEIDTAIGKLYYPVKWKDKITIKDSEDLRLVTHDFDDKLEKERFDELCAMQEDSNVILNYLEKDKDYKP